MWSRHLKLYRLTPKQTHTNTHTHIGRCVLSALMLKQPGIYTSVWLIRFQYSSPQGNAHTKKKIDSHPGMTSTYTQHTQGHTHKHRWVGQIPCMSVIAGNYPLQKHRQHRNTNRKTCFKTLRDVLCAFVLHSLHKNAIQQSVSYKLACACGSHEEAFAALSLMYAEVKILPQHINPHKGCCAFRNLLSKQSITMVEQ